MFRIRTKSKAGYVQLIAWWNIITPLKKKIREQCFNINKERKLRKIRGYRPIVATTSVK